MADSIKNQPIPQQASDHSTQALLPLAKLDRDFFNRHSTEVAVDLLGQILVFNNWRGIITETEGYRGADDPACHAFKGPTPRTQVMFGKPGLSYVYFIYGMYHCLNVVTEAEGSGAAVLIRGVQLLHPPQLHLNGPGKICRTLQISREHNGIDLTTHDSFYIASGRVVKNFLTTPRIGIKKGIDKLWRFVWEPPFDF